MAEHQFKQALSAYWPQVNVTAAYKQQDEDVNFILPENTYAYNLNLPGLGPLAGQITVPEQDVTVMDRESIVSSLDMTYPLFTDGFRSSMAKAAKSNVKAAMRRSELELIRDVQRMYYGVVLAQRLADIGAETLLRLETTVKLTQRLSLALGQQYGW